MKSEAGETCGLHSNRISRSSIPDIIRGNRELAGIPPEGRGSPSCSPKYAQNPPPATFRVIVNPLVSWIWIGALIALAGAALAAWPTRSRPGARLDAAYRARISP